MKNPRANNESRHSNRQIDDLQIKGLQLIQNRDWFCFGVDAVLLSDFIELSENEIAAEFGAGNGVISILASAKYTFSKIYAIEMQPEVAELAKENVLFNHLEHKIDIINASIDDLKETIAPNSLDVIFTNPPYVKKGAGILGETSIKTLSRHESNCGVDEFIYQASKLLKKSGRLYMVHRPSRLVDIFVSARSHHMEPKEIRFVHPKKEKAPNIVLIKCVKEAGQELKILDPIYVYNSKGEYSDQINNIYGRTP